MTSPGGRLYSHYNEVLSGGSHLFCGQSLRLLCGEWVGAGAEAERGTHRVAVAMRIGAWEETAEGIEDGLVVAVGSRG